MRTNGEFDRGIDARRNNTALRTVASRRPGRLHLLSLAAGGLTAVLIAAFATFLYPANVEVAAAASPCPAVNDWCTTMTVADAEGDGLLKGIIYLCTKHLDSRLSLWYTVAITQIGNNTE